MATIYQAFTPEAARYQSTALPQFKTIFGSNFPVSALYYDASSIESAYWKFIATSYGSGNLTLLLHWYADTASSGDVVWGGTIGAITPDSDTQDVETKSFATQTTVTDSHLGTTGQRLHQCSITISNLDSLAADDEVYLRIQRVANDSGDTMAGDAALTYARLSYSDT